MNANEYQRLAARTLLGAPERALSDGQHMLAWNALGLAGEAGEVADAVKKAVFHGKGLNLDVLAKELGDVLWYVSALCSHFGIPLSEVMELNIAKLKERYPEGWDAERSHATGETPTELGPVGGGP